MTFQSAVHWRYDDRMKRPDISEMVSSPRIYRRIRRGLIVGGLVMATLGASGCGGSSASSDQAAAAASVISQRVSGAQGKELVDRGAIVIDVRTPAEFAAGHVPGALLIDVSAPTFAGQIADLDRDQAYVVYCRSGNRSAVAISQMLGAGFTELYDMGPLTAWANAGHPVVAGS